MTSLYRKCCRLKRPGPKRRESRSQPDHPQHNPLQPPLGKAARSAATLVRPSRKPFISRACWAWQYSPGLLPPAVIGSTPREVGRGYPPASAPWSQRWSASLAGTYQFLYWPIHFCVEGATLQQRNVAPNRKMYGPYIFGVAAEKAGPNVNERPLVIFARVCVRVCTVCVCVRARRGEHRQRGI